MVEITYFKSLASINGALATQTFVPEEGNRIICQTIEDVLRTSQIVPNTYHSKLKPRLCVSLPTINYTGSYRPEGILFSTQKKPDYCSPLDLMALTTGDSLTSSDYGGAFIPNAEEFIFDSIEAMLELYSEPSVALAKLNSLRQDVGLLAISSISWYNECCFEDPLNISPIALVGKSDAILKTAEDFDLPVYASVESYTRNKKPLVTKKSSKPLSFFDFLQKSSVGALYRVGASFTIDAIVLGLMSGQFQDFIQDLDPEKLLRVAAYVVAINFVDYRFNVTNRLFDLSRKGFK